jgi:hypothetical protein
MIDKNKCVFDQMVATADLRLSGNAPTAEDVATVWAGKLIDSLQRDKLRLDWLADTENSIGSVLLPTECVHAHLDDMRAAIDMAMGNVNE